MQALSVEGGALVSTEEVAGIHLESELLRIAPATDDRISWTVAYRFESERSQSVPVAFPVEISLERNQNQPGRDVRALRAVIDKLARGKASAAWTTAAAEVAQLQQASETRAVCCDATGPLARAVAKAHPLRLHFEPGELGTIGIDGFTVTQDSGPVSIGAAVVEIQPSDTEGRALAEPSSELRLGAQSNLGLTAWIPFTLEVPEGASVVVVQWQSPALSVGAWSFGTWRGSYDFGPGRTWDGPIDRVYVAIDQSLLRGTAAPSLPFDGPTWLHRGAAVYETTGWEPAPRDHLYLSGEVVYGVDGVPGPYTRKSWAESGREDWNLPWQANAVGGVSIGDPVASSTLRHHSWVPKEEEQTLRVDLSVRADNLMDGGLYSGWCGDADQAWVEFDLPHPTTALRVHGGNRNPWFLKTCGENHGWVAWGDEPDPAPRCFHRRADPVSRSYGRPVRAELSPTQGTEIHPVAFDQDGIGQVGPLPAGRFRLTLLEVADDRDTVCIAEIEPEHALDPTFSALAAAAGW